MAQDTAAKDAIVRISAYSRQTGARPPPPERTGAFTMKTEENNGVIAMIDELIAGLDNEMTVRKPRRRIQGSSCRAQAGGTTYR